MQNELSEAYGSQNPQTNQMAAQGRKGDSMMAHVTPGDYVIPKDILVQHPEFLVKLKKVMEDEDADYRSHMVGSGFESINPETGAPEFGFFGSVFSPFRQLASGVGRFVGGTASKLLPEAISQPLGNVMGMTGKIIPGLGGNYLDGYSQGMTTGKNGPEGSAPAAYSPSEMALPGSLRELGGLTDEQRRSYLATQGSQGEGLGGNARDYYANLLQRNIQADKGSLMPVESQYLGSQGINTNLSGQALIEALRGF